MEDFSRKFRNFKKFLENNFSGRIFNKKTVKFGKSKRKTERIFPPKINRVKNFKVSEKVLEKNELKINLNKKRKNSKNLKVSRILRRKEN